MKKYTVRWDETSRFKITIEAPDPVAARETFWWFVHDGTIHEHSIELAHDNGEPNNVTVTEDNNNLLVGLHYKHYLEAQ